MPMNMTQPQLLGDNGRNGLQRETVAAKVILLPMFIRLRDVKKSFIGKYISNATSQGIIFRRKKEKGSTY